MVAAHIRDTWISGGGEWAGRGVEIPVVVAGKDSLGEQWRWQEGESKVREFLSKLMETSWACSHGIHTTHGLWSGLVIKAAIFSS